MELQTFIVLGEALGIGLLIGVERYRGRRAGEGGFAGVRTFALLALSGALCGLFEAWAVVVAVFAALTLLIAISYSRTCSESPGLTTEFAALLTFWLGFLMHTQPRVSIGTAIVVVVLLAAKSPLHEFVRTQISGQELFDTLKFLVVVFVVFPLLPNRELGPYQFFNPRQIWFLIILVSSISYAGYFLIRVFGEGRGLFMNSLLGGLVSTTATTMSLASRAREFPGNSRLLGVTAVTANSMQFPRLLFLTWFVDAAFGVSLLWPLAGMFAVGNFGALLMSRGLRSEESEEGLRPPLKNPYSFLPALKFGLFFMAVYFLSRLCSVWLGEGGALLGAAVGGLASVSAVALTTAKLVNSEVLSGDTGIWAILAAVAVNTSTKWVLARLNGGRDIAFWLGGGLLTMLAAGALLAVALR